MNERQIRRVIQFVSMRVRLLTCLPKGLEKAIAETLKRLLCAIVLALFFGLSPALPLEHVYNPSFSNSSQYIVPD